MREYYAATDKGILVIERDFPVFFSTLAQIVCIPTLNVAGQTAGSKADLLNCFLSSSKNYATEAMEH